jgi:D-threo-aldose 1-dehydrogenase
MGIVAAAVFNSGVLASPRPGDGARYDYGRAPADVLERAAALGEACARHGVELPAAALQYPLREPVVRSVVVGAASPAQVRENVARMHAPIPGALWATLAADGLVPA